MNVTRRYNHASTSYSTHSDSSVATISLMRGSRRKHRRDLTGCLHVGQSWRPTRTHFSMHSCE